MSYRDNVNALIARNEALEAEVASLRRQLTPAGTAADLERVQLEIEFLMHQQTAGKHTGVILTTTLGAIAVVVVPAMLGGTTGVLSTLGVVALLAVVVVAATIFHTSPGSRYAERIAYLQGVVARHEKRLSAPADSAPSEEA